MNEIDPSKVQWDNVGMPQGMGQFGPGTKYTPDQMTQLNAARDALRAAEDRGASYTYNAIDTSKVKWDESPKPQTRQPDESVMQSALIGAGKNLTRLGQGVQQAYYAATGNDKAQADLAARVAEEDRLYAPLQQAHPIATTIGEALPSVATINPLAMAAVAAAEYGSPEERAVRGITNFVGGKLGEIGGHVLGRIASPVRVTNPGAASEAQALASRYGVELTPAQATGSKALAGLEGTLAQLPGSASVMASRQQAQRTAFNRAAMNALGESADSIGNDAAQLAKQSIGGRIQQAAAGAKVPVEPMLNDLAAVEARYNKNLLPDQRAIVKQYMDDILSRGPTITGEEYQQWRSRIGARAASTGDSELKGALKGIQSALDKTFMEFAPEGQAAAMKAARGQYRNFKTLEPLIEKASMSSSNIPPAQVMNRALVTGNTQGEMGGLAQLGQVIGREYPNSGTVPRLFWQELLQHPLGLLRPDMLLGATTVPYLAARAMTSKPAERYLTNGLLNISPEVDALLKRAGGVGGGILAALAQ